MQRPLWLMLGLALVAAPAATFAQNPDCTLIVPNNPFTAQGLATPYQLVATNIANGACNQTNTEQSAFVQAAIIDVLSGQVSIYNPLVIDKNTAAATAPVVPHLPFLSVVALWFGYNGGNLTLVGAGPNVLANNDCHQGMGQFAYCNAIAFFATANTAIALGALKVPPLGMGKDNRLCPSVRSFAVVDQDQSDNLPNSYIVSPAGTLAQNTAANLIKYPGATKACDNTHNWPCVLGNPSDNRLTDLSLDGALNCQAWTAPDLGDPGKNAPALPLNELQAQQYQTAPVALIPLNDPFVFNSLAKVNEYRAGAGQIPAFFASDADPTTYCANFRALGSEKLVLDRPYFTVAKSPRPNEATNLFTFMAKRFSETYTNLGCDGLLHQGSPVTPIADPVTHIVYDAVIH